MAITQLHALQTAAYAHLLSFIAEYDRRQAWREDGCTSMTDWLVSRLNIARRTANDLVAIAGRLTDQPAMTAALADGALSLDQVRAASQLPDVDPAEAAARRPRHWRPRSEPVGRSAGGRTSNGAGNVRSAGGGTKTPAC